MTEQATFEPEPLSSSEYQLWMRFRDRLRTESKLTFTSDDFRMLGFDRFLRSDRLGHKNIGALFIKLEASGYITRCGSRCSTYDSNHGRRIQVWKRKL